MEPFPFLDDAVGALGEVKLSKKTKAEKHARRVRSGRKRKHTLRPNPLKLPTGFSSPSPAIDAFIEMAFDQALLQLLRTSGIRDALLEAIKNAPPKKDEDASMTPELERIWARWKTFVSESEVS